MPKKEQFCFREDLCAVIPHFRWFVKTKFRSEAFNQYILCEYFRHVYAVCSSLSVENLKYFKYALLCDNQEHGDRVLATLIIHDFGDRL